MLVSGHLCSFQSSPSVGPLSTMSDPLSPPIPPVLLSHASLSISTSVTQTTTSSPTLCFRFLPGTHHMDTPLIITDICNRPGVLFMSSLSLWHSVHYSMHSTFKSCLHASLCNPYMPHHNLQFVSCLLWSAFSKGLYTHCNYCTILTIHWWEIFLIRSHDGLHRIKYLTRLRFGPIPFLHIYTCMCISPHCDKWNWVDSQLMPSSLRHADPFVYPTL